MKLAELAVREEMPRVTVGCRIQRSIRVVTPPPGSLVESTVDIVHERAHLSARCTCLSELVATSV